MKDIRITPTHAELPREQRKVEFTRQYSKDSRTSDTSFNVSYRYTINERRDERLRLMMLRNEQERYNERV